MSKKIYSVSLDSEAVATFKESNSIKLSTFLNDMLLLSNNNKQQKEDKESFKKLSDRLIKLSDLITEQIELTNKKLLDLDQGNKIYKKIKGIR